MWLFARGERDWRSSRQCWVSKEYLSYDDDNDDDDDDDDDDDVETHQGATDVIQVDWRETTWERCIQEVTNDVVENRMELDYKGSDQELEKIEVVDNLKLVNVMHMLEQIRTMTWLSLWTNRKFIKSYDCIYKKVLEMSISGRTQTSINKFFTWVFIIYVLK